MFGISSGNKNGWSHCRGATPLQFYLDQNNGSEFLSVSLENENRINSTGRSLLSFLRIILSSSNDPTIHLASIMKNNGNNDRIVKKRIGVSNIFLPIFMFSKWFVLTISFLFSFFYSIQLLERNKWFPTNIF